MDALLSLEELGLECKADAGSKACLEDDGCSAKRNLDQNVKLRLEAKLARLEDDNGCSAWILDQDVKLMLEGKLAWRMMMDAQLGGTWVRM